MTPSIEAKRHSLAHILAQAVLDMFPEAKLGVGPAIENGFYYDFELPRTLIPEDLVILEKKMKHIVKQNQAFTSEVEPIDKAIDYLTEIKQTYKIELAEKFKAEGSTEVGFSRNGPFVDLCRGGHIESTNQIKNGSFKLDKIAGAYWLGSEKNPMLQRIYGLAFEEKEGLDQFIEQRREAEKRDHRKLGKALDIFAFSDNVGAGLPLWLPNGGVMIEELENLAKEMEFKGGYDRVRTPHLTKGKLYELSGHLAHYKDDMYPAMHLDGEDEGDSEAYYMKPMNCPHHHMIFDATAKSYRDLPVRYAEYGTCYRYEGSGSLFGLMRVRSLQMNDAHIYCTEAQFAEEFKAVTDMYLEYFRIFGIKKYKMRLSLHNPEKLGEKYLDMPELWKKTEDMVRESMNASGVEFTEVADEAAFYGPKIDIQVWSAIGREFTLATNQVDFGIPGRMGLKYTDEKGEESVPLCIHRAPLSTHERMIGFLIEHFGGAFPAWLAPVQVALLPVASVHQEYADALQKTLRSHGIRTKMMDPTDSLGKRIRTAEKRKTPYMLVMGDKEVEGTSVTVRDYKTKAENPMSQAEFVERLVKEIKERTL